MVTLLLSPGDIEKVCFAYSPLIEVSNSFQVLLTPEMHPNYPMWVEETRRKFDRIDFPYLRATILPHQYFADFLTPTPTKTVLSFEDEIDRVRETPDAVIVKNIELAIAMGGMTPIRREFLDHPRETLECLIEEVRFYWQQALEPHWTQLSAILESDVQFRAHTLARYGIDAMFNALAERVEYRQGSIRVEKPEENQHFASSYQLKGEGIQLVPTIFNTCATTWQVAPEYLPMIGYQTRGLGLWRSDATPQPGEALHLTLGTSRARLLQTLVEPAHTHDLALRLSLTAGAVSQQLGRLSQAGLVESYRSGSKVYYRLSTRGERLLDVFSE